MGKSQKATVVDTKKTTAGAGVPPTPPVDTTNTPPDVTPEEKVEEVKTETLYVWLKTRAYVDDTLRLNSGLYRYADKVPDRLVALSVKSPVNCEVIPEALLRKKLYSIARWAGINPEEIEDDELVERLAQDPKPFKL